MSTVIITVLLLVIFVQASQKSAYSDSDVRELQALYRKLGREYKAECNRNELLKITIGHRDARIKELEGTLANGRSIRSKSTERRE